MARKQHRRDNPRPSAGPGRPAAARLKAPTTDYVDDAEDVLTLRGSLSPASRRDYAAVLAGSPLSREDAWHRAAEFLFERLAVRWVIAGVPVKRQRDLLDRYRAASPAQRAWVRASLRAHCTEYFPDVEVP
jgi:hypothetical protein